MRWTQKQRVTIKEAQKILWDFNIGILKTDIYENDFKLTIQTIEQKKSSIHFQVDRFTTSDFNMLQVVRALNIQVLNIRYND